MKLVTRISGRTRRRGYSLIDVLVGVVILSIAMSSAMVLSYNNARNVSRNQNLAAASLLAQSKLEELRNLDYAAVVSGDDGGTIDSQGVAGGNYTRTWTVTDNSPSSGLKTVLVQVSW